MVSCQRSWAPRAVPVREAAQTSPSGWETTPTPHQRPPLRRGFPAAATTELSGNLR